jgi:membrane-associated phospholipid phosphatase
MVETKLGTRHATERLRTASFVALLLSIASAAVLGQWCGIRWNPAGTQMLAVALVSLLGAGVILRRDKTASALSDVAEMIALMALGGLAGGALAMISLRSGVAPQDARLQMADRLLGFSAQGIVEWTLIHAAWVMAPLKIAYQSVFPQLVLAIVLLPWFGRALEAWRLIFTFIVGLAVAALISFVTPALASYATAKPWVLAAVPPGSGTYFLEAMHAFRLGDHVSLGIDDLEGVLTFPSFHVVMALMAARAAFEVRWLRGPAAAWNAVVIFSVIPIGGHYVVDIFGGVALFAACRWLAARLARTTAATADRTMLLQAA